MVTVWQPEGVGGCRHRNLGSIPRLSFPVQRPDSAAGETGCDARWSTAAACPASTPAPDAHSLDGAIAFHLQQPYQLQLHRSVHTSLDVDSL